MAKKRLLTWHRPSRRWKKQIGGVVYYFGYGRSEDDARARIEAERRYFEFMEQREGHQPVEIPLLQATLADVAEKYMQQLVQRHDGKQVSASYLCKVRTNLADFLKFVGGRVSFTSITELILADYRAHTCTLPVSDQTGARIRPATAKDRLAEIKAFIQWAHEMRLLAEVPRNLRKYARIELPEPEPKRFDLGEIRKLWCAAGRRMRCFIALGLNCGYGQRDISELRVHEIDLKGGYIERRRSKTGVRCRHKLWPVTVELVKSEMVRGGQRDDRVFVTVRGNPLVNTQWRGEKLYRTDSIACLFRRLLKKVGIDGGRSFYSLRKTGASEIEAIDPTVTELYLAHAERGMKRNYAERNWATLDGALDELATRLDLPKSEGKTGQESGQGRSSQVGYNS